MKRPLAERWVLDLRWGLLRGLLFGAVAVAPATIALGMGLANAGDGGIAYFLKRVVGYCAFGAIGGLFAGIFRPHIQVRRGATVFGSFLGVLGFAVLRLSNPRESGFEPWDLGFLLMGACAGAILGWFTWGSFRRHRLL